MMQDNPDVVWLFEGRITCPDVADMWGAQIGDPEFNLCDHPTHPSSSSDHPTKYAALQYAKQRGIAVVDRT